jgi:chromosome condensin MukBEF ATPase and DNA-binding subunit MukB
MGVVNNDLLQLRTTVNKITTDFAGYQHFSLMAAQSKEKIKINQKHTEEEFQLVKDSIIYTQDGVQEIIEKFTQSEECNVNLRNKVREAKAEINQAFELISQLTEKFDQLQIMDPAVRLQIERIASLQNATSIPDIQHKIEELEHGQRTQRTTMEAELLHNNAKVQVMTTQIDNLQFDTKALQNKADLMQVTLTNLDRNRSNIKDPNIMLNGFFENFTLPVYLKKQILAVEWFTRTLI